MTALEKLLIKYADAYDAEKKASKDFSSEMYKSIRAAASEIEDEMKAKGEMSEYGSLDDIRYKEIMAEIKSEAFGQHHALWVQRGKCRATLGALKRSIIKRAKSLRSEIVGRWDG